MISNKMKKKLAQRSWSTLKQEWRVSFQDYSDIGCPPPSTIRQSLIAHQSALPIRDVGPTKLEVPELRFIALREAIYLGHKAGALLRSFNRDVMAFDTTYPEITGYTGALFLSKSISLLLGTWLSTVKIKDSFWIADLHGGGNSGVDIYKHKGPAGHVQTWDLFTTSLRKVDNSPLDPEFISFCCGLSPNDFAGDRNSVQYNSESWLYDDLHALDKADISWINPFDKQVYVGTDPSDNSSHFGIILFLMLYRAHYQLLSDIGEDIVAIKKETEKMLDNINECETPIMAKSWIEVPEC